MSGFSTVRIVLGAMAVAVAIRCVWPARQPLAEERASIEHGDHGLFSSVRQD
jgi:hypothetical protein